MTQSATDNRRPLASRSTAWARALSNVLVRTGASPDHISVMSMVFAAIGSFALLRLAPPAGMLICAACVQARLLCNLLDGMVAIEGGRKSATGALFNEIPDRVADSLFIIALGHAAGTGWLGWFGALAAATTAYIRTLGGALEQPQDFRGPMAKPHRMAVMTASLVIAAAEHAWRDSVVTLEVAAWIIAIGSIVTCGTRTFAIARRLRAVTP
jgi:phosphatidylglycerophosphate synthase